MDTAELHKRVNWLHPARIIALLEGIGIAIRDDDTIGSLREAVREAVLTGDISSEQIDYFNPRSAT